MNKYKNLSRKARKERRKQRMCLDKVAYGSRQLAEIKGQDVYKCPHCGLYHRTTKVAKVIDQIHKSKSTIKWKH